MSRQKYYLIFASCCLSLCCLEALLLTNLAESVEAAKSEENALFEETSDLYSRRQAKPLDKLTNLLDQRHLQDSCVEATSTSCLVRSVESPPLPNGVSLSLPKTKRFKGFKPPGSSQPNYTIGAATRKAGGICSRDLGAPMHNLTALVSSADRAITMTDRPTFLAYVPKTSAKQASLIVKNASEQYFYRKNFTLPEEAGIVSISLPKSAPALQAGQEYTWSIVLVCGESLAPSDPFVSGKITRVTSQRSKLQQVFPLDSSKETLVDRANFYQKNLIWYDTLATVAALKKLEPTSSTATNTWQKLLEEVDLADLVTEPLVWIN
ncbi:MAG: DUF928 domain-containing protein [Xenococcaceae cyanobacterium]